MSAQYLYRIQPTRPTMLVEGPTEREGEVLAQHFAYLQGLAEADTVILAGRTLNTDSSSFGIVIFVAETEDVAQAIMNEDPAVKQGVMNAEIFPYRVALIASENL